ncbi:MAG: redoxin family protein [Bacteroidia bacterium]|nr:redoxin family protein [Bacteroidia bacterium]
MWAMIAMLSAQPGVLPEEFARMRTTTFPDGQPFSGSQVSENRATVFVSLLPGCPICQKQAFTLNELASKYQGRGIVFYGVWYPGVDSAEMRKYIVENRLRFAVLADEGCALTSALGIEIAPEVVAIDSRKKILYRGKIDNWFEAVGKRKPKPTQFYLDEALNAVAQDKAPVVASTTPVGCIVECARRIKSGLPLHGKP